MGGLQNISLIPVLTKFITYRKVVIIAAWNALYEGFMFLGPPLAIDWCTRYVSKLYLARSKGEVIPEIDLLWPSIAVIVIFTGLPFIMAVCNSVSTLLDARVGVRLSGALSCAVFEKAQRMPVALPEVDDEDDGQDALK